MSVHVLFALEEFEEGTARKVELEGHQISLVRIDDDVYAIGDICSHEDVSLSEGYVDAEECLLECWRHGAMFNLKTGRTRDAARYSDRCRFTRRRSSTAWCRLRSNRGPHRPQQGRGRR